MSTLVPISKADAQPRYPLNTLPEHQQRHLHSVMRAVDDPWGSPARISTSVKTAADAGVPHEHLAHYARMPLSRVKSIAGVVAKRAGRWGAVEPGFNAAVADVVYDRIMKCADDETAALYGSILLGAALQHDLIVHGELIAKAAQRQLRERIDVMTDSLSRTAIAKARAGDTAGQDAAVEALGQLISLAKAFSGDAFTPQARAERARQQHRDLQSGKFVVEHHDIDYQGLGPGSKPIDERSAAALGIKTPRSDDWKRMSRTDRALYQRAYSQVAALLQPYKHVGDKGVLHLNYNDGTTETHKIPSENQRIPISHVRGKNLVNAQVSVIPPLYGDVDTGTALAMMSHPDLYNALTGGALNPQRLGEFTDAVRTPGPNDQFIPSSRVFRRLEHGSKLLSDSLGDSAPAKLKIALKVGEHVGSLGPEAQRVIGPTADKTAYRYRGTEKKPDAAIGNAIASVNESPRIPAGSKREFLIHGEETDDGWQPSPLLRYFASPKILPRADLNTLQRKAGTIPPSQGIIVDKSGKVVTQAVGYADDHYLPFNLKNLTKLKGGEYIRTRTWGGPTTEDIYTGLISGAKAITVVSHNGVYTVDFDDTLRGKRRFNDKAVRMVARYGHLLDAVRNGKITTATIDPTRLAEIRETATQRFDRDYDPDGYDAEVDRLTDAERRNPKLSRAQEATVIDDFLAEHAGRRNTRDGHEQSTVDVAHDLAAHRAAEDFAAFKGSDAYRAERAAAVAVPDINGMDEAEKNRAGAQWRAQLSNFDKVKLAALTQTRLNELNDPDPIVAGKNLATALGLSGQLDQRLQRAQEQNRNALKELELNGPGYEIALQALQEQFPYYIARVEYHPWKEGNPGGFDTGYVRPGRNRPQKALSGYFDPDLGGKVFADSTRYQRHGGHQAYTPRERKTVAGGRGAGEARTVDPGAEKKLRLEADMDLVKHIKAASFNAADQLKVFSGEGAADKHAKIENKPVVDFAGLKDVYPELARVAGEPEEVLRKDPERLHRELEKVVRDASNKGMFDIPDKLVRAHRNGGKVGAEKTFDNPSDALDSVDDDWDLHRYGSAYHGEPSFEQVEAAYKGDPAIQNAVRRNLLPATIDYGDVDASLGRMHGKLRDLDRKLIQYKAGAGGARPPDGAADFGRDVEALVKAKQLRRRYGEAVDREVVRQQDVDAQRPIEEVNNQVGMIDADELARALEGRKSQS